jgi:hypothetical protein
MAAGAFSGVAGGPVSPLPSHSKRLGLSGVRRRSYRLASTLHGGGGIAGCREGVFLSVPLSLGAFLHEPFCRGLYTPSPINRRHARSEIRFRMSGRMPRSRSSNVRKRDSPRAILVTSCVSYVAKMPETARFGDELR